MWGWTVEGHWVPMLEGFWTTRELGIQHNWSKTLTPVLPWNEIHVKWDTQVRIRLQKTEKNTCKELYMRCKRLQNDLKNYTNEQSSIFISMYCISWAVCGFCSGLLVPKKIHGKKSENPTVPFLSRLFIVKTSQEPGRSWSHHCSLNTLSLSLLETIDYSHLSSHWFSQPCPIGWGIYIITHGLLSKFVWATNIWPKRKQLRTSFNWIHCRNPR